MATRRYELEHLILPSLLFSEVRLQFLAAFAKNRENEIIKLLNVESWENEGGSCPYTAEDFKVTPIPVDCPPVPRFFLWMIEMPKATEITNCDRIYICHDDAFSRPRYYTSELTFDGGHVLCEWRGDHVNYGRLPEDKEMELRKVVGLYVDCLMRDREQAE